jgi:hypothetical protein
MADAIPLIIVIGEIFSVVVGGRAFYQGFALGTKAARPPAHACTVRTRTVAHNHAILDQDETTLLSTTAHLHENANKMINCQIKQSSPINCSLDLSFCLTVGQQGTRIETIICLIIRNH